MNQVQLNNHTLAALDGPGIKDVVPVLWSDRSTIEQHNISEQYLRGMPIAECDLLREQASRAYYNIIARHAHRAGKLGMELI